MSHPLPNVIGQPGESSQQALAGYDHSSYGWRPTPNSAALACPGEARVAVAVIVSLSAVEWDQGLASPRPAATGGRGLAPAPDYPRVSHREFGHRVGIFRLLDVLDEFAIPTALAIDLLTAEHYRRLTDLVVPRAAEVLAGGLSGSRPITSDLSRAEEDAYIEATITGLTRQLGMQPRGWLSPEQSESRDTPELLASHGFGYLADWSNDEVPYPMSAGSPDAPLWSFPVSWELSDVNAMYLRGISPATYQTGVLDAVDALKRSPGPARLLGLQLHPWISGQAFRTAAVEAVLGQLRADPEVWLATPAMILDHFSRQSGS